MLGKGVLRRHLYAVYEKLRYYRSHAILANVYLCGASVSRAYGMIKSRDVRGRVYEQEWRSLLLVGVYQSLARLGVDLFRQWGLRVRVFRYRHVRRLYVSGIGFVRLSFGGYPCSLFHSGTYSIRDQLLRNVVGATIRVRVSLTRVLAPCRAGSVRLIVSQCLFRRVFYRFLCVVVMYADRAFVAYGSGNACLSFVLQGGVALARREVLSIQRVARSPNGNDLRVVRV